MKEEWGGRCPEVSRGAQRRLSKGFARLASGASLAEAGVRVVSGRNAAQLGLGETKTNWG
jgi:hypothetical protein